MALTGLQIYKLLPQTNCKECGHPTCLAFAMKLAAKQAELSACPYVSEESKTQLDAASAPPIRLVSVSSDGRVVQAGNETVLFRHEKTFYHQPGLFVRVKDTDVDGAVATAGAVDQYAVDYVGLRLEVQGIAVEGASGDPAKFAEAIAAVRGATQKPLILVSRDPAVIEAGLKAGAGKPLIYAADKDNWQAMANLAKTHKVALAIYGSSLEDLAELTQQLKGAGVEDLALDPGARGFADSLAAMTQIRRLALKKTFRPLGFPIITFPGEGAESTAEETVLAGQHIAKYAGFVVLERFDPAEVYPLLVLRQNIFTDPQKPIQVQPGLYEINAPKADSPVMVTTNFSITYFAVANEVEGSGWPAWLLIADAEGMSVLTAWAAGKFDAERIAKAVKATGVTERINHKRIIIPGAVSVLSGELEEELAGWEIMVGPREAVDIPNYLKLMWS